MGYKKTKGPETGPWFGVARVVARHRIWQLAYSEIFMKPDASVP